MAKAIATAYGSKTTGEAVIKDKYGNLLVRFSSEDAEGFWRQLYEAERVKFAMKQRHKCIPIKYRTGQPCPIGIKQILWEIIKLKFRGIYARNRRN